MNAFIVEVYGYDPERFEAETRAKAIWKAYCAFREAGPKWDFHKFLINTSIRRAAT